MIKPVRLTPASIAICCVVIAAVVYAGLQIQRHNNTHAAGGWISGASGDGVANGSFAAWRGEPVTIAGTWQYNAGDTLASGGEFANWNNNMDFGYGSYLKKSAGESWAAAASGAYDSRWRSFLTEMNTLRQGKNGLVYIRPAYEFNGTWMNDWSVMPGEEANFIAAWRRFRGLQQQLASSTTRLSWCPGNGGNTGSFAVKSWPGPAYVDVVCIDYYNQYPWVNTVAGFNTQWNKTESDGSPNGPEKWRQWAAAQGKPLAFGEWSSMAQCDADNCGGDAPVFFQQAYNWMAANGGSGPGQFLYDVFFNVSSYGGNRFGLYPNTSMPQSAAMYRSLSWGNGGVVSTSTPVPSNTPPPTATPTPGQPLISQTGNLLSGKTFVSSSDSSTETGHPAALVNDKNETTRWISEPADNTTLTVDLGAVTTLAKVSVLWAGDTTHNYQIQMSSNSTSWTTVATGSTNNTSPQLVDTTSFSATATGRYLRVVALDRWNTAYGNSIWEIGAYAGATVGDVNGDSHVNVFDLSTLLSKWGTATATSDLNHDSIVNIFDLSLLLSHWTG